MAQQKARRPRAATRPKTLLASSDFTSYLQEKAAQLAPADLQSLVGQRESIQARIATVTAERPRFQRQAELALQLVNEHAAGACPQIPYQTVAMLAVALLYLSDPIDVIPDWIPGVGSSDDALVFELAFQLARPGIERYCAWKGIETDGILGRPAAASAKRGASKPRRRG